MPQGQLDILYIIYASLVLGGDNMENPNQFIRTFFMPLEGNFYGPTTTYQSLTPNIVTAADKVFIAKELANEVRL